MKNYFRFVVFALLGLLNAQWTSAQNVTIHGKNGSTLAARPMGTSDYDIFFKSGGFATWQHEQLALTMTASDVTTTTSNGQLANPANNIFKTVVDENTTLIQLAKGLGTYNTNYVSICLPKGYRFTGYSITFVRNSEKIGTGSDAYNASQTGTTTFGETTDKTFDTYKVSKGVTYGGEAQTISRTAQQSGNDWDMDNVLYFKMQEPDNGRTIITLTHAEFFFTAEADYTFVTPAETVVGRSAVDIPFATSKVDYGRLANETYDGKERMSYSSANITDVEAYLTLFEEESTKTITKAENTYDFVPGRIVDYKAGSIYSQGEYFRVGGKKANGSDVEQVYYIETPTYVTLPNPDATKSPIGYRIVGATIDYDMGTDQDETTVEVEVDGTPNVYNTFYISATRDGRTFYLTATGTTTEDATKKALWFIDENNYIRTGQNGNTYLGHSGTSLTTTTDDLYAQEWTIDSNGRISYSSSWGWSSGTYYIHLNRETVWSWGSSSYSYSFNTDDSNSNRATTHSEGTISIPTKVIQEKTIPAYKAAAFEIYKYDQTKKFGEAQSKETIEVGKNGKPTKGTITLSNLNNDAIKFGIKGTGLIKATLTLQALDPYIDQLDIVCQEKGTGNGRTLTQQFKATDFSVRGGKFNFYVPENFKAPCQFTFENLYSKYGDESYYTGTAQEKDGNARYSFVMSPYWTNSDVTGGQPIMNVYDTDPQASYTRKVHTLVAGDEPYKFNNADEFEDGEEGGSYQEYVFNPGIYGEDHFSEFVFQQNEMNGTASKIAYLFTCDETKYNIAPTNATQHTYYAYYQMEITMQKRDYTPDFTWTKIYDGTKSHYDGMNADDASSWGVSLSTSKASDNDEIGYLTVSKILEEINGKVGKTNYPKTKDQILYIDGSKLLSIVEEKKKENQTTVNEDGEEVTTEVEVNYTKDLLKSGLGANALVFLPYSSTSSSDNFAYVYNFVENEDGTKTPQFRGAGNFVLTDKKPFYSPYDITIDAANEIRYERQVTVAKNGKVTSASIIMPFEISIDKGSTDGSHTNKGDETWAFKLHQLSEGNCLGGEVKPNEPGFVYFPALTGVTSTTANVPYLVKVNDQNVPSGDNVSFVIKQNGTTIKATTDMDPSEYTFMGQGGSGTYDSKSYTFTNSVGSYSGKEVAKNKNIFYFAKNMFLCSKDYVYNAPINVGPFRAYYATSGVPTAKTYSFDIIFGENPNETTGIDGIAERSDLMVVPGYGVITITSSIDQNVRVHSTSGVMVNNAKLQAGETQTINVPAGLYIVNGVKIMVK